MIDSSLDKKYVYGGFLCSACTSRVFMTSYFYLKICLGTGTGLWVRVVEIDAQVVLIESTVVIL